MFQPSNHVVGFPGNQPPSSRSHASAKTQVSGWKGLIINNKRYFSLNTQEITGVLGALCQYLGTETKYVFFVIAHLPFPVQLKPSDNICMFFCTFSSFSQYSSPLLLGTPPIGICLPISPLCALLAESHTNTVWGAHYSTMVDHSIFFEKLHCPCPHTFMALYFPSNLLLSCVLMSSDHGHTVDKTFTILHKSMLFS